MQQNIVLHKIQTQYIDIFGIVKSKKKNEWRDMQKRKTGPKSLRHPGSPAFSQEQPTGVIGAIPAPMGVSAESQGLCEGHVVSTLGSVRIRTRQHVSRVFFPPTCREPRNLLRGAV
ncbi:MAG TPA: hypothetical protein PLC40_19855, partial [Candidatus Hydrogenedentes bacterium]|nr:hypothetical protein [Candidatus Hydrogenedentota bacterium]